MLIHPTLDLLHSLGLHGMAKGFKDLDAQSEARSLEHAEWLALLLEHEKTLRQQKRFETRARAAKLRHAACVEDVDYRAIRGLDRALFLKLAAGDWIRHDIISLLPGRAASARAGSLAPLATRLAETTLSCLPSWTATVRRARTRPRRWPLHQDAARYRTTRSADPGRLGTRTSRRRPTP